MTKITNLRPGCVGIDLQPPLKPMRREEDRLAWLREDPDLTMFTRKRRRADRRFVLTFIACATLALLIIGLPLLLG